ncbi:MAG: ATP-binding protein [Gemmatimonadales bacterium]
MDNASPQVRGTAHISGPGYLACLCEEESAEGSSNGERQLRCFQKALDTMQLGITVIDVEGRIVYTNPADAAMHGYTVDELIGKDVGILSLEEHRSPLTLDELRSLESWRRQSWNMRKDGTVFPVQLMSDVVKDERGEPIGVVTTCEDVTVRKRKEAALKRSNHQLDEQHRALEDRLRQAQKIEAVGQLTGGIAHDFNNLLSVILANAELIHDSLPPSLAELRASTEDIIVAGESGARVIAQLLGFSRQAELRIVATDLQKLVVEQSEMLRHLIPENIEIHTHASETVRAVDADRTAVQQILMNLVTNARDAMPRGGSIRLEVSGAELGDEYQETHPWVTRGKYVCVSVTDTGVGMDQQTQQKLFDPFFTTKAPGKGTGLGMAMIYGLMKQHRGFVHVYSEIGEGTTIKLYFPVVEVEAKSEPDTEREQPLRGGTETILIVEDEDILRRAASRALTKYGYTVLTAANGAEGLSLFRSHRGEIDMVLSDLIMPKLGGRDLFEAIRRDGSDVKFMFASGYSQRDAQERANLGASIPFIRKPWTLTQLAHQVRELLDTAD